MPASYANFYIANEIVIVPVFGDSNDAEAIEIIGGLRGAAGGRAGFRRSQTGRG